MTKGARRTGSAKRVPSRPEAERLVARRRRLWLALIPLGVVLVAGGWAIHRSSTTGPSSPPPTPASSASLPTAKPARPSLVDEQFRFRLDAPADGDTLRGPLEANRLHPNGVAALSRANGCILIVAAEYLPGAKLEDVVDAAIADLRGAGKKTTSREGTRRDEIDGVAYTVVTEASGNTVTTHGFTAERDGWFESTSWMEEAGSGCASLDEAFHFLPGKVEGRPTARPTPDEAHPLYRLRNGVYESAFHRLRVAAPKGTALIAGREAAMAPGAQVGVIASGFVAFIEAAPRSTVALDRLLAARVPGGELPPATSKLEVRGESISLYELAPPGPRRLMLAAMNTPERTLFFSVAHAPALESDTPRFLKELIDATTVLDAASAETLQRDLPATEARPELAPGRVVRARRFTDFEIGFEVELPASPALTSFGRPGVDPESVRLMLSRDGGAVGTTIVVRDPAADVPKAQLALIQEMTGAKEVPKDIVTESASPNPEARRMTVEVDDPSGGAFAIVVDTLPGPSDVLHVVTLGPTPNVRRAASESDAMVKSLHLGAFPETELRGGQVANHRFGFRMELPKNGWKSEILPGSSGSTVGFALRGERAGAEVTGYARLPSELDFFQTFIEQRFVGAAAKLGAPERHEHAVDGLPAVRLTWAGKEDVVIFRDGDILYSMRVQLGDPTFDPAGIYQAFRRE